MPMLKIILKATGAAMVLAGLSHVLMGPSADVLLGAKLPANVVIEPSLDSQNRFYGTAFTLHGALIWLAASDLERHRTILRLVLAWFFIGGLVRLLSLALRGWPSDMIVVLTLLELVLPPLLWWWAERERTQLQ
jgi:hypothetical protein